jgi:multidrug efflux pump
VRLEDVKNHLPAPLKKIAHSWWGFLIFKKRLVISMLAILLLVGGFSAMTLPKESTPEIKVPFASVVTVYPGASPKEVADQVTFELEQEIKNLEDLDEVSSVSSEGLSLITVAFEAEADIADSIRKLKDRVDIARPDLPDDAEDPQVNEISFSNTPVITFGLFGDLPYGELLAIAKDTRDELERTMGVQRVEILGEREEQILIAVRETELRKFGLSLRQIGQGIQSFHLNSPVGNVEVDELIYRVRIEAEQDSVVLIENIPLIGRNGATVYVKDVADVRQEFKEETTQSFISVNGQPAKQSISLSVVKKTGANILETVDEAKERMEGLRAREAIPSDVDMLAINDFSEFVRNDFDNLTGSARITILLIFVVLFFALGFKEALIAGVSIPFTFLIAFIYLKQTGNTLNGIVLFGLILGLGLLVDTAIVMMEGIHEAFYKKKMSIVAACLDTIKTYRYPLISGTLTTIAAFSPMLLMGGIMGQFFAFIPRTVNTVLISSLFMGILIMPVFAVMFMKQRDECKGWRWLRRWQDKVQEGFAALNTWYRPRLDKYLFNSKRRRRVYVAMSGLFVAALLLPILGIVPVEGFPLVDVDFMYVNAEAPVGTTLAKTRRIMEQAEDIVRENPYVESYVLNVGTGVSLDDLAVTGGSGHLASMTLNFVDEDERPISFEITKDIQERLKVITEADVRGEAIRSGPPVGKAIELRVFGEDYAVLQQIVDDLEAALERLDADAIDDNLNTGTAEFTFDFTGNLNKAILKNQGLTVADVAGEVRMAVFPTKVVTLKKGEDEVDVNVQLDWKGSKPTSIEQVKNLSIQNANGDYIALNTLTSPEIKTSLNSIQHFDAKQAVTVSADVKIGNRPDVLKRGVDQFLEGYAWPAGYTYELTGGNTDTEESFRDLFKALFIGLLLILLILTTQFDSFKQPIVIMAALPLSLIGVFFGFAVFRLSIGVPAFIGIVSLSGIVVNDAIVLIDRINNNRRVRRMGLTDAIREAGPARMQPILITSITTVPGIFPLTLTDAFWRTLGGAIIFGMLFSTVLTLLVIPLLYLSVEGRREFRHIKKGRHQMGHLLSPR